MTGSDLYTYVLRVFKRTDKSDEVYDAITDAIVKIRRRLVTEDHKTYADLAIVDGDFRVAYPTDLSRVIDRIILIDGDDSHPMELISIGEYNDLEPYPQQPVVDKDEPIKYAIYNGYIWVFPVSDGSYSLRVFYSTETNDYAVVAGTSPVPFCSRHRAMVRAFTLFDLYAGLGLDNEAAKWKSIAEELYQEFKTLEYDKGNAPLFIQPSDV